MNEIQKLRREAEREQHGELKEQALEAVELRARLPSVVEEAVMKERKRVTHELADSGLSQREISNAVDMSQAWVSKTINETTENKED